VRCAVYGLCCCTHVLECSRLACVNCALWGPEVLSCAIYCVGGKFVNTHRSPHLLFPSKGVNGFAKLQQANSRVVGGPVMVVHDEEEPSNRYSNARTPSPLRGNNNRGGRGLELRGNSEYIPISGDRDSIGNDQLEKLLRQSRNAR